MIKYGLLLDTETSGLDPATGAVCIEVAAMLYDMEFVSSVGSFSSLIYAESNGAEHVNTIRPDVLREAPFSDDVWPLVKGLADQADVVIAHRADFDYKFVPDLGKPWICTKVDFDWPGNHRGDHLVHLALAYGVGVVSAHRAMTDVDIMARIFTRVAELYGPQKLQEMLVRAMRPKKRFVSLAPFEQKELVKQHGFSWDETKREWYRSMPEEDVKKLPFRVRSVE